MAWGSLAAALAPASGNQLGEVTAGRGGTFSPKAAKVRLPDLRSLL